MELGLSLGIGRHRKRYCRRNRCVGFKYRFLEFGWFVDLGWILLEASSLDSGCFLSMVLICFSREGGINTNSAEVTLSLDFLFTLPNPGVDDKRIHNCNFVFPTCDICRKFRSKSCNLCIYIAIVFRRHSFCCLNPECFSPYIMDANFQVYFATQES